MIKKFIINSIQIITILVWISFLQGSDSYFIPYLLIAILAFICFYINYKENKIEYKQIKDKFLSVSSEIFALITLAANYSMFSDDNLPDYMGITFRLVYMVFLIIAAGSGAYFAAWNILYCFKEKFKNFSWGGVKRKSCRNKNRLLIIFLIPFLTLSILYIILLFACKYPGNLTPDSTTQISQLMTGNYSNHHPFYHTMIIKLFITIGLKIFGNMNAAVALYHVFQILFMAMCFSMIMLTLYEMNIQPGWIIVTTIWYALMPFHIMYSFTMWKDIMFGGFVLLFLVFVFRILTPLYNF